MNGFLITLAVIAGLLLYGVFAGVTFGMAKRFDVGDANDVEPIGMFFASMLWPIGLGILLSLAIVKQFDPYAKQKKLEDQRRAERDQAWHEQELTRIRAAELAELDRALARLERERKREV